MRSKIATENDVQPAGCCEGRFGTEDPRCVQHPLWRVWSGLRWTDRTSVETMARQLSHMARTIPQVSGGLCQHKPSHPNPGRQNPFHQTPVREPPYFFKTARSFCLDCWTLKIKLSSELSETFCLIMQHHTLQDMLNYTWRDFSETCVMVKYSIVEQQIIHDVVFCLLHRVAW